MMKVFVLFSSQMCLLHQNIGHIYRIQISKWMIKCNQIARTIHLLMGVIRTWRSRIWTSTNIHNTPSWMSI